MFAVAVLFTKIVNVLPTKVDWKTQFSPLYAGNVAMLEPASGMINKNGATATGARAAFVTYKFCVTVPPEPISPYVIGRVAKDNVVVASEFVVNVVPLNVMFAEPATALRESLYNT
jgi:hypothetical protein